MCRGGKDGVIKRCPSHADKKCINARNERRRELRVVKKERSQLVSQLDKNSISYIRGDGVPESYYYGEKFDRDKLQPTQDEEIISVNGKIVAPMLKPARESGLWTSPGRVREDGKAESQWTQHDASGGRANLQRIKPMDDAVIVVIDNREDLEKLQKEFPREEGEIVSFKKMSDSGIDGVHVTKNAIREASNAFSDRENPMSQIHGWDIESTFWTNPKLIQQGATKEAYVAEDNYDSPYDEEEGNDYFDAMNHYEEVAGSHTSEEPLALDVHEKQMDVLFNSSTVYEKKGTINARKSKSGEKVSTVLEDGTIETDNVTKDGDYIVTNPGGEEYILKGENFASRYEKTDKEGVWKATGKTQAVNNPTGKPISIVAPWGEKQYGDENCHIANSLDKNGKPITGDRYIIGRKEFSETYQLDMGWLTMVE